MLRRRLPFDGDFEDVNCLAREQRTECGKRFHGVMVVDIAIKLILGNEVSYSTRKLTTTITGARLT